MRQLEDLRAEAMRQLGEQDFQGAALTLKQLLHRSPHEAMAHGKLGLALASIGRETEAMEHLTAVAKHDPDLAYGDALLGWIHYLKQQPRESARHYRIAIGKQPYDAKLHYQYGLTLLALNQQQSAEQSFRTALEINPGHHDARLQLVNLLRSRFGLGAFERLMPGGPATAQPEPP